MAAVVKLCQSFLFQSLANRFNSQNVHHLSSISINLSIQWASRIPQCLKITQEKQIKITNDITGKTRIIKDAKILESLLMIAKEGLLEILKNNSLNSLLLTCQASSSCIFVSNISFEY